MKTSANTHSGLKRNENFASTGKDLRDWPGRTGRGILRLMSVGMALGLLRLLPVWVFYLFAVWVFARCSVWFLTAVAGARLCVSDSYTRLSVCLILHIR